MRFMGIDYGTKRVGIALSDTSNAFALPHKVIQNSKNIINDLNDIVCHEEVTHIIMGESKNYKQEDNEVMVKVRALKENIENTLGKTVVFEPEFLSSHQAEMFQGKNAMHDASAAAIILQSYLDKLRSTS